jgi:predicted phage tail protein
MNTIRIYGQLAKQLGQRVFEAAISTPAEAFRFLMANFPETRRYIVNQRYAICIGSCQLTRYEQLHDPLGQQELRIIPIFSGNDIFGFLGNVLSAAVPVVATIAVSVGASYLAAALQQPAPQVAVAKSSAATRVNFSFNGVQNTAQAGVPIPIVYGEVITGSVIISTGLDTVQVKG